MPRASAAVLASIPLLSFGELQAALRVSKPVLRALILKGAPHVLVGSGRLRSARRFRLERVLAWLEARSAAPPRRRGRPHREEVRA